MDNLKWRSSTRILAIVDLVLSSTALLVMVISVTLGTVAAASAHMIDAHGKPTEYATIAVMWIMWITLAIFSFLIAIELWAAVTFLKATKEGAPFLGALKGARIWRNVNIAFFILSILNIFATTWYATVFAGLVFRTFLLCNVCNFIEELEKAIAAPDLDNVALNQ